MYSGANSQALLFAILTSLLIMLVYLFLMYRFYWPAMTTDPLCAWYVTIGSILYTMGAIFMGYLMHVAILRSYEVKPPEFDIDSAEEAVAKVKMSHLTVIGLLLVAFKKLWCKKN